MENVMTISNTRSNNFYNRMDTKSIGDESKLRAIEVELFSYNVHGEGFDALLDEICGPHFRFQRLKEKGHEATYQIAPMDHCLIEGGMMYTSAGSIVAEIVARGIFIKGYQTIVY